MKAITRSVALLLFFATLAFGDESVQYSANDADVRLTIVPDRRRVPPNIFGCYSGFGSGSVSGVGGPPSLAPGQATSFRYLLKGYDLFPGHYTLTASGKAGVRAEDGVRIDLPAETPRGDWQLFIGPIDGRTPMQNAATVRLM